METITQFDMKYINQKFREACVNAKGFISKSVRSVISNNGRIFNWSLASYQNNYIIVARLIYFEQSTEIVPGNRKDSAFEKGENFWWIDWSNPKLKSGTLYFICDHQFNNMRLLDTRGGASIPEFIESSDLRIMNNEMGDIYIYNPKRLNKYDITPIIAVKVKKITDDYVEFEDPGLIARIYHVKPGNNYAMIKINDQYYLYLDWFTGGEVKYTQFNWKAELEDRLQQSYNRFHTNAVNKKYIINRGFKMNNPIDGDAIVDKSNINFDVMPLFSFGTPHVKYDNKFIGVGHIKIYTDESNKYKKDSNIDIFRKNLYKDFTQTYHEKYIRHDAYNSQSGMFGGQSKGYNYLMYFYYVILDDDNVITEMKISDSFLPVYLANDQIDTSDRNDKNYKFSLIFPMGVTLNGKNLLISAGYGDFYSVLMTMNIDEVINLCKYDISNIDLNKYEYKIIATDNKHIWIDNSLSKILSKETKEVSPEIKIISEETKEINPEIKTVSSEKDKISEIQKIINHEINMVSSDKDKLLEIQKIVCQGNISGGYHHKYLKYKNKYLTLKHKINETY
jgi:hypothetical protein